MASVLTTVGSQANNSFESYASGSDLVSAYDPYDDYVSPLTGAIGDSNSRPIMFRYLQIYTHTSSSGSIDLQIATGDTGSGGVQSASIAGSDADPDWNVTDGSSFGPLQYATFSKNSSNTTQRFYYGYQKNSASTYYPNTGASPDTGYNPNNIYLDGTVISAWSGRALAGRIGWYHVPEAPTSATLVSRTTTTANTGASSIAFRWTHPTDDGISTSLSFGGLYGYRIAYKKTADSTWLIFGSDTTGSPSGCEYIQGTSAYNYTTTPPVATPSSSNVFTTTGAFQDVTGLDSNTNYDFKIAGLNLVTDRHNGAAVSIVTTSPTSGTRAYGDYTATGDHVGTNLDVSYRTLLADPTVSGSYTSTANVNEAYSSNVTWTQPAGGGAVSSALTYNVQSGSLPTGLSLNTSTGAIAGTPTTPGTYNFTIRATNGDSGTATTSTQTITVGTLAPKVWNGSAMTRSTIKIWNGTNWTSATPQVKVWDSTLNGGTGGWKYLS
jgi:hypothetical protein